MSASGAQDPENLRLCYEGIVKHNPNNVEAVNYLAVWHLERQSFQQVSQSVHCLQTLCYCAKRIFQIGKAIFCASGDFKTRRYRGLAVSLHLLCSSG
jgi:hypothetical protein